MDKPFRLPENQVILVLGTILRLLALCIAILAIVVACAIHLIWYYSKQAVGLEREKKGA